MYWSRTIKDLRRSRCWKQTALAEVLGVSQSAISHWERGADEPSIAMQGRIKNMLTKATPESDRTLVTAVSYSPNLAMVNAELRVVAVSKALSNVMKSEVGDYVLDTAKYGELHNYRAKKCLCKELYKAEIAAVEYVQWFDTAPAPFKVYAMPQPTSSHSTLSQTMISPITVDEHDAFIRQHGDFMTIHPIE